MTFFSQERTKSTPSREMGVVGFLGRKNGDRPRVPPFFRRYADFGEIVPPGKSTGNMVNIGIPIQKGMKIVHIYIRSLLTRKPDPPAGEAVSTGVEGRTKPLSRAPAAGTGGGIGQKEKPLLGRGSRQRKAEVIFMDARQRRDRRGKNAPRRIPAAAPLSGPALPWEAEGVRQTGGPPPAPAGRRWIPMRRYTGTPARQGRPLTA